jgi:hypothetical protein
LIVEEDDRSSDSFENDSQFNSEEYEDSMKNDNDVDNDVNQYSMNDDQDDVKRIDTEDIQSFSKNNNIIRFAHFSIKKYLLSKRVQDAASKYAIHEISAHKFIATLCLTYLLQFENYEVLRSEKNHCCIIEYSLSYYAAKE